MLRGASRDFGEGVGVFDIDIAVPAGTILGIVGPSGAGKTTTIRMIAGVLRPTSGRVLVDGRDIFAEPAAAKRRLGYIPDRPFLYEKLTGMEFLRFVSGLWGENGSVVDGRAMQLLEMFELAEWKDTLIESYSHGMRQKLLISSALVHAPSVIVVDEPMVGLDPKGARLIKELLRAFAAQGGTVFLSTHTLEVAEALCDRIAILYQGRIRAMGSMDELRAEAAAGGAHLEEVFLKLTGVDDVSELVSSLRGPAPA